MSNSTYFTYLATCIFLKRNLSLIFHFWFTEILVENYVELFIGCFLIRKKTWFLGYQVIEKGLLWLTKIWTFTYMFVLFNHQFSFFLFLLTGYYYEMSFGDWTRDETSNNFKLKTFPKRKSATK